jgi:hypothetical protein
LEATSVAGLGNEVAGVAVFDALIQILGSDNDDTTVMELDRAGIADVARGRRKGFSNEVKNIRAISIHGPNRFEARSIFSKELERYLKVLLRVLKGTWILLRYRRRLQQPAPSGSSGGGGVPEEIASSEGDDDDYRRFLLGEAISDDEEEYRLGPQSPLSSSSSDNEEDDHPAELYHNLATDGSPAGPVPVLLAHMVDSSSFPLTRQRYQRLVANAGQPVTPTTVSTVDFRISGLRQRCQLNELSEEDGWDEGRMNCVICTAKPRQVICWPCRWVGRLDLDLRALTILLQLLVNV